MTYDVRLTSTGDSAEGDTLDAALLAAETLVRDVATHHGSSRLHRQTLIILRDDRYDGLATALAREGRRSR